MLLFVDLRQSRNGLNYVFLAERVISAQIETQINRQLLRMQAFHLRELLRSILIKLFVVSETAIEQLCLGEKLAP